MNRPLLIVPLMLVFCLDLGYSFYQHKAQPLDGDLPHILAPADDLIPLLENPTGLLAIKADTSYLNPNRFFSHASLHEYMTIAPIQLQTISEPIESVYLATAMAKTMIQLLLLMTIASIIHGGLRLREGGFWIALALLFPFFQSNGYHNYLGIIDSSITYTFFYALPLLVLMLYLLPTFYNLYLNKPIAWPPLIRLIHAALLPIACLSGPLNPGIALVLIAVITLSYLAKALRQSSRIGFFKAIIDEVRSIPADVYGYIIPLALLSLYSLYIGMLGSFAQESSIPISEIYSNLPQGLWRMVSTKLGVPLLILAIGINALLIRKLYPETLSSRIRKSILWLGIFVALYILLLPFGGFRAYRPNTLRFDTFLPVTVCLIFMYASTGLFLLNRLVNQQRIIYSIGLIIIAVIYTLADKPEFQKNACEKAAFAEISASEADIVELGNECTVMDWRLFHDPALSQLRAKALYRWNITETEKLYYNKK